MSNNRRSVLKTKSLPRYVETITLGFFTCLLAVALALLFSTVAVGQTASRNSTPDPYFNQSAQSRATQPSQPFSAKAESRTQFESVYVNPKITTSGSFSGSANGTTPPARGQLNPPAIGPTPIWNAPLTPVSTSAKPSGKASGTSALSPIAQPSAPAGSIIREPQNNPNDFSSNGFAKLNPAPTTIETPHQRPPVFNNPPPSTLTPTSPKQGFRSQTNNDFQLGSSSFSAPNQPATQTPMTPYSPPAAQKPVRKTTSLDNIKFPTGKSVATKEDEFKSFEPGKVLALVGGEPIFVGDLMFDINQVIEKFLAAAPENIKERERQKMIPQLLPRFVEKKLLYHGMLRQLPDEVDMDKVLEQATQEFDEKALKPMLKNSGLKSVSEFDAHLRAQGSSLRHLRESWARDQLTMYFLAQSLKVKTEVTHQEMLDVYRENIDSYAVKAKVRWEQIMIRFDRSKTREDARRQLAELGNQIVHGANFAAVARKDSHGFLASSGGQQDWTSRGALVLKEIDEAIFTLPVGSLSNIIESSDGYHIIRVLERTEDSMTPFLEAQVDIKKKILNDKANKAQKEYLAKLRDEIPVEYYFDDPTQVAQIKTGSAIR